MEDERREVDEDALPVRADVGLSDDPRALRNEDPILGAEILFEICDERHAPGSDHYRLREPRQHSRARGKDLERAGRG